ncbi:MAG: Na+/H+ antiporter NhaC family protein [Halodesulfurarchaeum sp.]
MAEFGALSLLPPVLAIVLAIITRKAVLSLFLGVWVGGVVYTGGVGIEQTFVWIAAAIGDSTFHAQVVIFLLLLGAAIAMIWRLGGSHAVRNWTMAHLDTRRKAGTIAWLLGIVLFFDDYANTAIVGSSLKDVADHLRISREKLSYIVDSTAAPVSTLGLSSWVAYQLTMIRDGYAEAAIPESEVPDAITVFIASIPYNMYAILAIVMVGVVVLSRRDYGEMLGAEHRAMTTGAVNRPDARPMQDVAETLGDPNIDDPKLRSFFLPIGVLVAVTIGWALYSGWSPGASINDMLTGGDYAMALVLGSFAMVASTYLLALHDRSLSLSECVDATIDGFSLMLTAVTILVLAWSIGNVAGELGTGQYVAGIASESLSPAVLPVVVLLVTGFVAFAMGSAWAAMSIVTPIVIPVAWSLAGTHEMVAVVVGMVFSGAIFGDHTSPISDTTVLSATFTGADLIDHVRTQLPYALTVAAVVSVLMLVWGVTRLPAVVLLVTGTALLIGLVYGLSALDARRRSISPTGAGEEAGD